MNKFLKQECVLLFCLFLSSCNDKIELTDLYNEATFNNDLLQLLTENKIDSLSYYRAMLLHNNKNKSRWIDNSYAYILNSTEINKTNKNESFENENFRIKVLKIMEDDSVNIKTIFEIKNENYFINYDTVEIGVSVSDLFNRQLFALQNNLYLNEKAEQIIGMDSKEAYSEEWLTNGWDYVNQSIINGKTACKYTFVEIVFLRLKSKQGGDILIEQEDLN